MVSMVRDRLLVVPLSTSFANCTGINHVYDWEACTQHMTSLDVM
jgi:hypothetical protein